MNQVRCSRHVRRLVFAVVGLMLWMAPKTMYAFPYGQRAYGQGVYGQLGTPAPTATPVTTSTSTAMTTAAPTASASSSTTTQPTTRTSSQPIPGAVTSPIESAVSPTPSQTVSVGNNQTPSWLQSLKNSSSPEPVTPPPIQTGWSQKTKIMFGLLTTVIGLLFLFWLIRRKPKRYYEGQ